MLGECMKKNIAQFFTKFSNCKQVKAKHQRPGGLLQQIKVPTWKWEDNNMDFVVGLPQSQKNYDSIWVVMDWLTMYAHFIPAKYIYSAEDYARIFTNEIVCHHGIPLSIISDRGAQYTSRFWRSFKKWLVLR